MSRQTEHLADLELAITQKYRCKATHRETAFVHEKTAKNETVWKGDVAVFDLTKHAGAAVCYAWQDIGPDGVRIFTILESRLIDSPQRAVQAAIFFDAQAPNAVLINDLAVIREDFEAEKRAFDKAEREAAYQEDLRRVRIFSGTHNGS